MFMVTAHAKAPEFTLQFNGEQIIHNQSDWQYAAKASDFRVYVEKGMIGRKNESIEFHAYLEFNNPSNLQYIDGKIKRIYTYGVISCTEAQLYVLMDLYTDETNVVTFRNINEFGTYVSDMSVPNTIRNEIYNLICKDSV